MAKINSFTKRMQAMLPQWMKMAKDPDSVGAQFLNVFGVEFEDVEKFLNESATNQYIGTANLSQIDLVYKVPIALADILDIEKVETVVGHKNQENWIVRVVEAVKDFYMADAKDHVAIFDRSEAMMYLRPASDLIDADSALPYDYVTINGADHYDFILHHVWNTMDEFGLLLGTRRLYGERNAPFKDRILSVFTKPANATKQGMVNALSRELGLKEEEIKANELSDFAFQGTLLNQDGSPTQKLIDYATRINKLFAFTWDTMSWNDAYWHSINESNLGLDYLPHVWDASVNEWKDTDFQSGIGDGNDLLIKAPTKQENKRDFKYYVGLRGTRRDGQLVYPELSFKYKITAKGSIVSQESKPEKYKYTVIASEIINIYFILRAWKDYTFTNTVDFKGTGYIFDGGGAPHTEIVDGTTMMSPPTNRYLEVQASLQTPTPTATPALESVTVTWKDTTGASNVTVFLTQADFDQNNTAIQVTKVDTITSPSGFVELGYGDFYHMIDTQGDLITGKTENTVVLNEGSVRLIPPK